ncbi:MAG: hypothetical protein H5T62_08500 [Anaerolineae bacterium]|nr:hypothetical protein [Anaerolineae bacterium]
MSTKRGDTEPAIYQIKVQGQLDERWADWFNGLTVITNSEDEDLPITTLTGPVTDQAALRGILNKIWDLNLTVYSLQRLDVDKGGIP